MKEFLKKIVLNYSIPIKYNRQEREFYVLNRNFWRKYYNPKRKSKDIIVVEYVPISYVGFGICFLASIIAKIKKSRILLFVSDPNVNRSNLSQWAYYSFPGLSFYFVSDFKKKTKIKRDTQYIFDKIKNPDEILEIKYKGLQIGDIIYDTSQKLNPQTASVWSVDQRIHKTLYQCILMYECLEEISKEFNVKSSCNSHTIGLPSLIIRYFLRKGIESYVGVLGIGAISKYHHFNNDRLRYHFQFDERIYKFIYDNKKLKARLLKESNKYIENRLNGKSYNDIDGVSAYKNKKEYTSKDSFCTNYLLDKNKQIVFIMLHVFTDYPNHFSKGIYSDYYIWFINTLKEVKKLKNINWIFKEHPTSNQYPCDANIEGIFEVSLEKNILFLNSKEDISTKSLINISDLIITCTGTSGLEMACFGIPCIINQPNHFTHLGIANHMKSKEQYTTLLQKINNGHKLKKLSKDNQEKARIAFYIMYELIGYGNFNKMFFKQTTHEERLKNNINEILSNLIEYYKNNKIDLIKYENFISSFQRKTFWLDKDLIEIEEKYIPLEK